MTLFRKVFQNQSQPAPAQEELDEAALREAFRESDPLQLDEFEQAAEDSEPFFAQTDTETINDDEDEFSAEEATDDARSFEEDLAEAMGNEASDEEDAESGLGSAEDVLSCDAATAEASQEEEFQSDEEIAACLDRALAAQVSEQEPALDLDDTEAACEEETVTAETEVEEATETETDLPRVDASADALDVTSFAQQQMATLEASEEASEAPESSAPALDLSGAVGIGAVPAPAAGRAGRRAGRVKTRLLGFNRTGDEDHDPFGQAPEATASAQSEKYPVGWLVIVEGPGVGHSFSIFTGASMIGRGEDQVIRLDFGDNSISRHNHAAIAYDEEQNKFYIGHGGKSNIIRRNARPVLSTEELHHADLIRIGETTLRFVALCGSDFQWSSVGGDHASTT